MKSYKSLSDIPEEPKMDIDLGGKSIPVPYPGQYSEYRALAGLIGAEFCIASADGDDYVVKAPNGTVRLRRDTDFGVIPGTKQPSLYKAGAEQIACAFGLLQHYTTETAIEQFETDDPFCFYRVRCDLTKIGPDGRLYVIATGYGSANTKERRVGRSDVYNAANGTLKIAAKRSLVAAAISVSSLSGLFSQDMENESYINDSIEALNATKDPTAPINIKQKRLLFARIGALGLTTAQGKKIMVDAGFPSVSALTQQDFAAVLQLFETPAQKEAREAMKGEPND